MKTLLATEHGVACADRQQLYFGGHELLDRQVLGSTGLIDGAVLELVVEYSESLMLSAAFFLLAASAAGGIASWMAWQDSFGCGYAGPSSALYVGRGFSAANCASLDITRGCAGGWNPPSQQACPVFSPEMCVVILADERTISTASDSDSSSSTSSSWCRAETATLASSTVDSLRHVHMTSGSKPLLWVAAVVCAGQALCVAAWLLWRSWCLQDQRVMSSEIRSRLLPHCRDIDPETV